MSDGKHREIKCQRQNTVSSVNSQNMRHHSVATVWLNSVTCDHSVDNCLIIIIIIIIIIIKNPLNCKSLNLKLPKKNKPQ